MQEEAFEAYVNFINAKIELKYVYLSFKPLFFLSHIEEKIMITFYVHRQGLISWNKFSFLLQFISFPFLLQIESWRAAAGKLKDDGNVSLSKKIYKFMFHDREEDDDEVYNTLEFDIERSRRDKQKSQSTSSSGL